MTRHIPPSKARYNASHKTVSAKVTLEVYDRVQQIAKEQQKSLSEIFTRAVLNDRFDTIRERAYATAFAREYLAMRDWNEVDAAFCLPRGEHGGVEGLVECVALLLQGQRAPAIEYLRALTALDAEASIDEGLELGELKFGVTYPCSGCGKPIRLRTDGPELAVVRKALEGWGHRTCHEASKAANGKPSR